jgi:hypothetical protein
MFTDLCFLVSSDKCEGSPAAGTCIVVNGGVTAYYTNTATAAQQDATTNDLVNYFDSKMKNDDYLVADDRIRSVELLDSNVTPADDQEDSDITSLNTQEEIGRDQRWIIAAASVAGILCGAIAVLVVRKRRQNQDEDDDEDDFAHVDKAHVEKNEMDHHMYGHHGHGHGHHGGHHGNHCGDHADRSFDTSLLEAASTTDLTMASTFMSSDQESNSYFGGNSPDSQKSISTFGVRTPRGSPNSPGDGGNGTPMLGRMDEEEEDNDELLFRNTSSVSELQMTDEDEDETADYQENNNNHNDDGSSVVDASKEVTLEKSSSLRRRPSSETSSVNEHESVEFLEASFDSDAEGNNHKEDNNSSSFV